jgi:hypothetical protein
MSGHSRSAIVHPGFAHRLARFSSSNREDCTDNRIIRAGHCARKMALALQSPAVTLISRPGHPAALPDN